jgi:hypothetical protein
MSMKHLLPLLAFLCLTTHAFSQGSLTPPAAPTPTMKTLDQIEARTIVNAANTPGNATNTFIISQPGSYYFTGNITGASGKHGISIQADDVTLDLNGFALISGGGGAFRGVNVPAAQTNFCVRNGSVRGWTGGGVQAAAAVTLAEKLMLANNTGAVGLDVGNGSMIKDCVASGNATGFHANDRTQITSCISTVNTGVGFDCTSYVTLIDCTSSRNSGNGIVVQGSCTVIRCNSSRNIPTGIGISAGDGCTIANCTAGSNGSHGILAGTGCSVVECTSYLNISNGISVGDGTSIHNCTARSNGLFGIVVPNECYVVGNNCSRNMSSGAAGLIINGISNRVDSNLCVANAGTGMENAGGANNLIIRNTARGNAGGNFSAILENTGGTEMAGNAYPWLNFSY